MRNIRASKQGSIWRMWDLHLHTPSSYDYDNKGVTNDQIISALKAANISAVAITDHHIIDIERINELKQLAGDDITIFPGIEIRSELGGTPSVHYTGIFPESSNLTQLWRDLSVATDLTPEKLKGKNPDKVYCPFVKGAKAIHELGGLVAVHAGTKSNTIENISNATEFKQEFKTDLLADHVDILEVGKKADVKDYRSIVFKDIGFELPIITCSDNHNANNYVMRCSLWIKADATFLGLKQTIIEPLERVHVGDLPLVLSTVESNPTKFMDSVEVRKNDGSKLTEKWFDHVIPLNHGLIAIIGNKGSGKSALADIIGLLGDCSTEKEFSFLKTNKFRDPRNPKAKEFWARLDWHSGTSSPQKYLSDSVSEGALESVKYIPQFYLERICSDYEAGTDTAFDDELKGVIFSHVPIPDRLGMATLDDLLAYKTEERNNLIDLKRKDIKALNQKIADIERKLGSKHKLSLKEKLDERERALKAHDKTKPKEVASPAEADTDTEATKALISQIDTLQAEFEKIEKFISESLSNQESLTRKNARIVRLRQKISNFKDQFAAFSREWEDEYADLAIPLDEVITFRVDMAKVDQLANSVEKELKHCTSQLDLKNEDSLAFKKQQIKEKLAKLRDNLTAPMRAYNDYKAELSKHNKKRQSIVGSADAVSSLEYFKNEIAKLDKLPLEREKLWNQRNQHLGQMHKQLNDLVDEYKSLHKGVQEFIDSHKIAKEKGLNFSVAIRQTGFVDRLLDLVDKSRKGNLRLKDEAGKKLRAIVNTANFTSSEGVIEFIEKILKLLEVNLSNIPEYEKLVVQLRTGRTLEELYDYLYGLEYLNLEYQLTWDEKTLAQLSPGERGTLLLIFYLLVDKGDIPLIIDQPEENLDNQTIYEILVPCIREAKHRRQIILVTHNPNLAVVCDAEQVIHAALDKKKDYKITYTAGAIENPKVNRLLMDVLEGTRPAFDVRDRKYRLEDRWEIKLKQLQQTIFQIQAGGYIVEDRGEKQNEQ